MNAKAVKNDPKPEDAATLIEMLQQESALDAATATAVAQELMGLAAKHLKLCHMDLDPGLTDEQSIARDGIEEAVADRIRSVAGIKDACFIYDPRGTTVGIRFESGAYNSFVEGGSWKIPVSQSTFQALNENEFWREYVPAPNICGYYIDLDERGSFRADVRTVKGNTVFEIAAGNELGEDECSIFDDGFMKDKNDLEGLTEHLRGMGVIGPDTKVLDRATFEDQVDAWSALRQGSTNDWPSP